MALGRRKLSDEPLELNFDEDGGTVTVHAKGRLDSVTSNVFQEVAFPKCEDRDVVLDLEDLNYMSSAGLRCVLGLDRAAKDMRVVNASGSVKDVLEMSGFGDFMSESRCRDD